MYLEKNASGLYEFDVEIIGPHNNRKTLKGLVDTGSTECVATYKIITTLKIRPIDYIKISIVEGGVSHLLCYSAFLSFDGHQEPIRILRVSDLPKGIHFILGMSILDKCNIYLDGEKTKILWRK